MVFIGIYWVCSIAVIGIVVSSQGMFPGLSALGTSILSFVAGSGLKTSLYGSRHQKIAGISLALLSLACIVWIGAGFSVKIFGHQFTG